VAHTALDAQTFRAGGLAVAYVTPDAAGVSFRNTGRAVLHVKNGSAAAVDVTLRIGRQVLGQSVTSPATPLAAGSDQFFGPFGDDYEQPASNDLIFVDFSVVAGVSVALLQWR
jgi:hypothetical protein